MDFQTKDDGNHIRYPSGALRSNSEGKGRFDLVSPYGLLRLAQVYERGGKQKGDRNWEKGFPVSRALSSAIGHIYQRLMGMRDEDHTAQAVWQLFAVMHFEEMIALGKLPKELLNIPTDTIRETKQTSSDMQTAVDGQSHFQKEITPTPKPDATALPLLRSLLGFMQRLGYSQYAKWAVPYAVSIKTVLASHSDEVAGGPSSVCSDCKNKAPKLRGYLTKKNEHKQLCDDCFSEAMDRNE